MARLRLRPSSREKELSTKGSTKNREQREKIYPRRATKGLAEAREGSAKGRQGERKDFQEKAKRFPRRTTKGLEKAQEGSAKGRQGEKGFPRKGKKISTKGHEERRRATKGLAEAREGSAKGRQGERKDFQEKAKRFPRRTLGLSVKGTRIRELTRSKADKRSGRFRPAPGGSKTRTSPREGPLAVDRSASGDDRWQTSTSPRNPVGR